MVVKRHDLAYTLNVPCPRKFAEGSRLFSIYRFWVAAAAAELKEMYNQSEINIRPWLGNQSRDVSDPKIQQQIRDVVNKWILK